MTHGPDKIPWPPPAALLCRGQPDKLQCIDCVQLGSAGGAADTATAVLALARCSGAIELRSPLSADLLGTIPPASSPAGNGSGQAAGAGRVRGLHLLWGEGEAASGLPAVLSVTQGGMARLHAPVPADGQQQQQKAQQQQQQQAAAWQERRAWQVPAEVCCTAYDPASGRLAVGCQGAELRLFDVASGELAFAFKGGKPNMGERGGRESCMAQAGVALCSCLGMGSLTLGQNLV